MPFQPRNTPSAEISDIRWGSFFYDAAGKKVFSVSLAGLTDEGTINGKTVRFEGRLRPWFLDFTKKHFT